MSGWMLKHQIKLVFLGEWALYLLFEIVMGRLHHWSNLLMNLLPFVFFYLVAVSMTRLTERMPLTLNIRTLIILVISMVTFDHFVKYLIRSFVLPGEAIPLISDWLFISNVLNEHGSFLTSRFDLQMAMIWIIVVNIIVLFLMIQGYRYYKLQNRTSQWLDLTLIFLLAGGVSSLIDKIFFGGSLDFLGLQGLFVADLKDFYLTIGLGCMMVELLEYSEVSNIARNSQDDQGSLKEFFRFAFLGFLKENDE